jgi:predicted CXXCH cytochrome family protein
MKKLHLKFRNGLVFLVSAAVIMLFALLLFSPSQEAKATAPGQSASTCKSCHAAQYKLWSVSKHGSVPIDCETCHSLEAGEGTHPALAYTIKSQALTCETCHADKAAEWKSSRHGEINLGCASCHEPHSQQQKVLDNNQLICANCHKDQYGAMHDSTHAAAGLTCENCHLGKDSGHTFKATIASCESCHSDIHEDNRLIAAGVVITPIAAQTTDTSAGASIATQPAETSANATAQPAATPIAEKPATKGGINLPSWLLLIFGLLIGGFGAWAIFGQDPGTPNPEK